MQLKYVTVIVWPGKQKRDISIAFLVSLAAVAAKTFVEVLPIRHFLRKYNG